MVVLLIASLLLSMNTATADGSRALYGIARDGMTIKQLDHLNRFHVPARAMTIDMLINLALVFFVGNILAIYVVGNIGYILAHFFALSRVRAPASRSSGLGRDRLSSARSGCRSHLC